jgi:hypothetical protein
MRTSVMRAPISGGAFAVFFALFASGLMFLSSIAEAAPSISGTPKTFIRVNSWYSWVPTARDPAVPSSQLRFSIVNKPAWAQFSVYTGRLEGVTPRTAGTWSNIRITVRSSTGTATLPAFSIQVATGTPGSGSATLSWTPPTRNTNGTTLTNLAGYRIYYGTSPSTLTRTVTLNNAGLTRYVVGDLSAATWYFSIRAYTSSGSESANSNTVSKVVR